LLTYPAEDLGGRVGGPNRSGGWNLWSNGELVALFEAPVGGTYRLRSFAYGQQAGPEPARMTLRLDNIGQRTFDVLAEGSPQAYEIEVTVEPGVHTFAVAFINDYYMPDHPDRSQRDRNLIVERLEVEGPYGVALENPLRDALVRCDVALGASCVEPTIAALARRAWRAPLAADQAARLNALIAAAVGAGADWEEAMRLGMKAVLLSHRFFYLVEADAADEERRLAAHELASRLAYFLWDTTPDETLLAAADGDSLDTADGLALQVERMLADPRANALLTSFFAQWLHLANLDSVQPDYHFFPDFDDQLRHAMRTETDLVLHWLFAGNRPLSELFTNAPTFVDRRLASHYGIAAQGDAVPGFDGWFQTDASAAGRGGLITNASILTLTSFPTRTSPVKRGKWVLERLLCDAPPPPPPGVEGGLDEVDQNASLRERLAQHRSDPSCAVCHMSMDPIGLGMEGFDGVGARHEVVPDVTGALPDGRQFDGVAELQAIIAADERLSDCFVRQVLIYALARAPRQLDNCHRLRLVEAFQHGGDRVKDLFSLIAQSRLFTHRRRQREGEQ
jgi:hypothetical protein